MADDKVDVEIEIISYDEGNGQNSFEIGVDTMISRLVGARHSIPEEDRATAVVSVWAETATVYINVVYQRAITAEEVANREESKKRSWLEYEMVERMELARLMNKYGWPPPEKLGELA